MSHPTLISNHVGTNPIIISERHAQHSHLTMWEHLPQPCQKDPTLTSVNQCRKGSALTLGHARNQSSMQKGSALTSENQCQKGSALIFDHARNQSFMSKGICTYIWQTMSEGHALTSNIVGTNPTVILEWPQSQTEIPGNWPGVSIPRMATTLISNQVGTNLYDHIKMAMRSHLIM